MTHAPKLVMVAALWLAVGGCASRRAAGTQAPATSYRQPATLRVHNAHWSDIRIYVVRLEMPLRLGTVTSGSSAIFEIPPDFVSGGSDVSVVAVPVAGAASYRASLNGVTYGDFVDLTIENLLQYSHLVIR